MTTTYTYMGTLAIIECAGCHMDFGITPAFVRRRRADHKTFWCPAGCSNHYPGESALERAQRERDAARAKATAVEDQLQAARDDAEQVRRTLVRERARFAAGVCPCCDRSFVEVRRHIETKHPDYDVTRLDGADEPSFRCSCGFRSASWHGLRVHQGRSSWGRHETKV